MKTIINNRFITIERGVDSSQSKNCWFYLQIGSTAFYFWCFWNRWWGLRYWSETSFKHNSEGTGWRLEIK
jgi:hypothetical protein